MRIYVIGHLSPDLDAIASAALYAEFLTKSKRYEGATIVPTRAGEPNKETSAMFDRFGVEMPVALDDVSIEENDGFILVDHNEESQRHAKIVSDQILEIIDHHKINISFTTPIRLDVKPLGSTSSLVYEHFDMYGIKPSDNSAGLLLAAILSDTQGLKSSTTTGYDSEIAHKLAEKLKLDLDKLSFDIFKAKSDITGMTTEEIVTRDYKVFEFGDTKVFINQIETVEPDKILELEPQIVDELRNLKSRLGVGQAYNVVTDILKINSHIIYSNEEEKAIVEKAFTAQGSEFSADIGPKMSRKKDIAPALEQIIS